MINETHHSLTHFGRGNDLAVKPTFQRSRLSSHRTSLISVEHAELPSSTPSLVLCCAWLVAMALHVHCNLGKLNPLPTSGDDE